MAQGETKLIVQRSAESWAYFYALFGFAIATEGTIISMIPLPFPYNLIAFAVAALATGLIFLRSEQFQQWLLNARDRLQKGRPH